MPTQPLLLALALCNSAMAVSYTLPSTPPSGASPLLDPAAVSVSIEFSAFENYMTTISATKQCLANLGTAQGKMPALRIGGNSQDRTLFNGSLAKAVVDADNDMVYGPNFITLAAAYEGDTTFGLCRKLNNLDNTIAAATYIQQKMPNLYAIELGNEPDSYAGSAVASGGWGPAQDAQSEVSWQASVGAALNATSIIQAGTFFKLPTWGAAELAPKEGTSAKYVKTFSDHGYPQTACNGAKTDLPKLMSHSEIVSYTQKRYTPEVAAVNAVGKILHIGETNSASCGGGGISPMFGAALWIVDYVMQGVIVGAKRLYFHQGGAGCAYCWWATSTVAAPYYGAYFAAGALGGADQVAMLDTGATAYAAYAIYKSSKPIRILLYNSDYFDGGSRSQQTFTFQGLSGSQVSAKRLTAPSATSRQEQGSNPTVGGQVFLNGTCELSNDPVLETITVSGGGATFNVGASEALLISL